MNQLSKIQALYLEIDEGFETQRSAASNATRAHHIEEKQKLNDQAWFILGWGQLENAVMTPAGRPSVNAEAAQIAKHGGFGSFTTPTTGACPN